MGGFIDLTGLEFNRLRPTQPLRRKSKVYWICQCRCGNTVTVQASHITAGHTKSCGCLKIETVRRTKTKHGHSSLGSSSPTYNSWASMIKRCTNPNERVYKYYGGRGIKVCKRWLNFQNFLADMGERKIGTTLDRKNVNGNYTKKNCYWSTRLQQARNTRRARKLTFNGKTLCMAEWSEQLGLKPGLIGQRLSLGWSVSRALSTPAKTLCRCASAATGLVS
jgi:hypothetical protein